MTRGEKRKDGPGASAGQDRGKKKKTGNAGKWKTPHHQAKQLDLLQPGDKGIWVTCARHQEAKAMREVTMLFGEYAEKMYGIKPKGDVAEDEDEDEDIEASIQKEVAALTAKAPADGEPDVFTPMKMNVDCLVFVKTAALIEPVEFVRRICLDAKDSTDSSQLKCRYVNRLTPVVVLGKANESGLVEVAKAALAPHFDLTSNEVGGAPAKEPASEEGNQADAASGDVAAAPAVEGDSGADAASAKQEIKTSSFAIRPTIRNHSAPLKRDFVIQSTAGLINQDRHKVNLTSPDKVILIDIYQNVCGMSVVDGDWDDLKKYNLSELYSQGFNHGERTSRV